MTVWSLVYEGFVPEEESLRETLCTLGNGHFATRGAAQEADAGDPHYPGTYLAGGYNRLRTLIAGHEVENEDLVNLPNWLPLRIRVEGGEWFHPSRSELLHYRQELDLKQGVLHRFVRFRDPEGRITRLASRRLVHMTEPHLAAIETVVTAENWGGELEILSALDGRIINDGVRRYREYNQRHLEPLDVEAGDEETVCLRVRTVQSDLRIAQGARTRLYTLDGGSVPGIRTHMAEEGFAAQGIRTTLQAGGSIRIEKIVSLYTSRDSAISEPALAARTTLSRAGTFGDLLGTHAQMWEHLWGRFDLDFRLTDEAAREHAARIVRLHIFHLLQTVSPHSIGRDVGVPSRGWHGEAYRGHIFWDELFIFPLLNLRLPEITRSLLLYRFRRLGEAKAAARAEGFEGAMYPWQSGSDGREETQRVHLNPKSGRWLPDHSRLQRHVNVAIAYNIWHYYQVTHDLEFLQAYGAEMLIEISRFWASLARLDPETGRYEIAGVMGPDEYHDAYPGSEEPGLRNNTYTNLMVVWALSRALDVLDILPEQRRREITETLELRDEEFRRWEEISRRMRVVFVDPGADGDTGGGDTGDGDTGDGDTGGGDTGGSDTGDGDILSPFEGWDDLEEFDWEGYRAKYGNIQRLDRILEAEGDTVNRYKASKQADVLMLFYLFSAEEVHGLLERLGYAFPSEAIPRNIDYHLRRTSHGSTLSRVVHSWVLARSDRARAWGLFLEALESDLHDIQGGTTAEGIHLGAMAGTVDLLQRGMMGIETRGDVLRFNPCLPPEMTRLCIHLRYRGQALEVTATQHLLHVRALRIPGGPTRIAVRDEVVELRQGETREFAIRPREPRKRGGGP